MINITKNNDILLNTAKGLGAIVSMALGMTFMAAKIAFTGIKFLLWSVPIAWFLLLGIMHYHGLTFPITEKPLSLITMNDIFGTSDVALECAKMLFVFHILRSIVRFPMSLKIIE